MNSVPGSPFAVRRQKAVWLILPLTGLFFFLLSTVDCQRSIALACPMCKEAIPVSGSGQTLIGGYARSIVLLMSTPYLLFAGITYLIIRKSRRSGPGAH